MKKSTRRKAAALVALLTLTTVTVLAIVGVPLVTVAERHFDATSATAYSIRAHWPMVVASTVFIGALVLVFFPRHDNAP